MNDAMATLSGPDISQEVRDFAAEAGINLHLDAVVGLARRAFPESSLAVSLGQDAEDDSHRYVALDVEAGDLTAEELLAGQHSWSEGVGRVCPPHRAVCFVLGWR